MCQRWDEIFEADSIIKATINCIDYIYDEDNVYYAKDTTKEELTDFVDNLQQTHLEKIKTFFDTLPEIKKDGLHNFMKFLLFLFQLICKYFYVTHKFHLHCFRFFLYLIHLYFYFECAYLYINIFFF